MADSAAAASRACGGCTGCCRILPIRELEKPANVTCTHCNIGHGCGIYAQRPPVCRTFVCVWLAHAEVGAHWYPSVSHMVLAEDRNTATLVAHVDGAFPEAWRQPPYFEELHAWAGNPTPKRQRVAVKLGDDLIAIFPVGERFLGPMRSNPVVLVHAPGTTEWAAYDAG